MKAVAVKNSSNEALAGNHKAAKHVQIPLHSSIAAFPWSIPYVQRKPLCACDGGCPRCAGVIQPKLTIGAPNDKYEQEADRVADQVMRMPEPEGSLINGHSSLVQRKAGCTTCGDKEEEQIQTKAISDQITPLIQRQEETEPEEEEEEVPVQAKPANNQAPAVTSNIESVINSIRGGGQPLPESTRSYFEPRFGTDFSQVRVHTDSKAAETAKSVNAKAFTTGKDVVFDAGQYAPETSSGNTLLAHELTHVVQQQGVAAAEDTAKTPSSAYLSPRIARLISTAPMGAVQRQATPLESAEGFRRALDLDRRPIIMPPPRFIDIYRMVRGNCVFRVRVVGHASPRWRIPTPVTAAQRNLGLSRQRAIATEEVLRFLFSERCFNRRPVEFSFTGSADEHSSSLITSWMGHSVTLHEGGGDMDANNPEFRRVDIGVEVERTSSALTGIGTSFAHRIYFNTRSSEISFSEVVRLRRFIQSLFSARYECEETSSHSMQRIVTSSGGEAPESRIESAGGRTLASVIDQIDTLGSSVAHGAALEVEGALRRAAANIPGALSSGGPAFNNDQILVVTLPISANFPEGGRYEIRAYEVPLLLRRTQSLVGF